MKLLNPEIDKLSIGGYMKKILIEGMSGQLGGLETYIYTLYKLLKDSYEIDFLVTDENIPFENEFIQNGSKIYRVTKRSENPLQYKKDINKVFQDNDYYAFWFNKTSLSSIQSLISAKKNGVDKIICHSHSSKNMGGKMTMVMHTFNKLRVAKYADYQVACSQVAADWFFNDKKNVILLPNGVDVNKFKPDALEQENIREELDIKNKFVIGHVGAFRPEKNHKFLIQLFKDLLKQEPEAVLLLCGDGPLLAEMKNLVSELDIEENVKFLSLRSDVPRILQAMDVFVMPSLFEGLPFVLVEAQAAGVPCVVADTVSTEVALTDIVEFESLNSNSQDWVDKILKYKNYNKISQENQLKAKGYTLDNLKDEIDFILK